MCPQDAPTIYMTQTGRVVFWNGSCRPPGAKRNEQGGRPFISTHFRKPACSESLHSPLRDAAARNSCLRSHGALGAVNVLPLTAFLLLVQFAHGSQGIHEFSGGAASWF